MLLCVKEKATFKQKVTRQSEQAVEEIVPANGMATATARDVLVSVPGAQVHKASLFTKKSTVE